MTEQGPRPTTTSTRSRRSCATTSRSSGRPSTSRSSTTTRRPTPASSRSTSAGRCGTSWASGRRSSPASRTCSSASRSTTAATASRRRSRSRFGYGIYVAYAMTGSYLGSRTGQTHALLTRSIFGAGRLVDRLRVHPRRPARLGRLPGEPARRALGRLLQLGRTLHADAGARRRDDPEQPPRLHRDQRLRALSRHADPDPLVHLHGAEGGHLRPRQARRHAARQRLLPFWVAVVAVIGFSMWGNEPDFWRYGKPSFTWPLPTYLFAASGSRSSSSRAG